MRSKLMRWVERIKIKLALRSPIRFRKWIELEEIKSKIVGAVREEGSTFPDLINLYLSTVLSPTSAHIEEMYWEDAVDLFIQVTSRTVPNQRLPLIYKPSASKSERDAWDYTGRTWHLYAHLIASAYGWTLDVITNLEVNTALALIQEILTDEQLEKEFLWSASELSVSYNPKTKSSKIIKLPRPYWMIAEMKPVQIAKMPIQLAPIGEVDETAIPEKFRTQKAHPARDVEALPHDAGQS